VQIVDNHTLVVRTRYPARITETIKNSKLLQTNGEVTEVAVKWGLEEAQVLRKLNVKNVPSPIKQDYKWPGLYKPMLHQIETASFLTLYKRAFCLTSKAQVKLHPPFGHRTTSLRRSTSSECSSSVHCRSCSLHGKPTYLSLRCIVA
jgi:hypothetical protein